jgi:Cof subfamily protein (haloacid dehalogenase superfamily)
MATNDGEINAGPPILGVLADVDGTLVTNQKILTPRAIEAVKRLQERGTAFAITSGRPPRGMLMLIDPLEMKAPIAAFNGGMLVLPNMTVLEERTVPAVLAGPIVERIRSFGLDAWLYRGADWYVTALDAPHVAREQWTVQFPPTVVPTFDGLLDRAVKIVGCSDDYALVARCEAGVQKEFGAHVSAARSQPYYLDVTHPDANKGVVAEQLATHLKIAPESLATIGDQPNDVLMFRRSGMSIAMGNASADVQRQARYVTTSNEEEGFANAVERFILPRAAAANTPA